MARLICIDGRMLGSSGIGTVLAELVPRMVDCADLEVRWRVVGPESAWRVALGRRAVEYCDDRSSPYSLRAHRRLAKAAGGATLYWSPHYVHPWLPMPRMVVMVQDLCHLAMRDIFPFIPHRLYTHMMMSSLALRAHRIIVTTEATRAEVARRTWICQAKVRVVNLAVSPTWHGLRDSVAVSESKYFLYLGNIKPHKNIMVLLKAFGQLAASHPGWRMVLVGQPDRAYFDELRAEFGRWASQVDFVGKVEDEIRVRSLVSQARALVFPSRYEGFGLPVLEAMAAGCPVICSRIAPLEEIAGDAALFFEPQDVEGLALHLQGLARDDDLYRDLQVRGRENVRRFDWSRTANEVWSILRESL